MRVTLKQNTEGFLRSNNYDVFLDKTRVFLIEKSIIPFFNKYIIREVKHNVKVGTIEGSPHSKKNGAWITVRRKDFHIYKSERRVYLSEWSNNTGQFHRIENVDGNWIVKNGDEQIAEWSYTKIIKFGKNHINMEIHPDADLLLLAGYAALFDIYRFKMSVGWLDSDEL